MVGCGQRDKPVEVDPALADPLGEQQRHAQFDAGDAVGGVLEGCLVAFREFPGLVVAIGRVVRGEHLERAVGEAAPHRLLARRVARRRAAAEFRALQVHRDIVGGQEEVLRAGLAVDLEALGLRIANDVDRLGGRDMDDQHRHIEQFRQGHRAVRRLALGAAGMRHRVIARLRQALFEQPVGEPGDHVVVFGMDHDERALAPRQSEDVEHLVVVEAQQVVRHVDLERGVAVADQGRQFLAQHLLRRVGDDQVEGVVDDRFGAGGFVIFLDDPAQRLAAMLRGKRNHCRGAAKRGRNGRAVEIVGAHDPGRGALLDMAMAVDRAGQDETARRVDLVISRREVASQCGDHSVLDGDIALRRIGSGRHRAVADDEIKVGHRCLLYWCLWVSLRSTHPTTGARRVKINPSPPVRKRGLHAVHRWRAVERWAGHCTAPRAMTV